MAPSALIPTTAAHGLPHQLVRAGRAKVLFPTFVHKCWHYSAILKLKYLSQKEEKLLGWL